VFVCESTNGIVLRSKPLVALLIISLPHLKIVAHAVDLDNHFCSVTNKVGNEATDGHLTSKGKSVDMVSL